VTDRDNARSGDLDVDEDEPGSMELGSLGRTRRVGDVSFDVEAGAREHATARSPHERPAAGDDDRARVRTRRVKVAGEFPLGFGGALTSHQRHGRRSDYDLRTRPAGRRAERPAKG